MLHWQNLMNLTTNNYTSSFQISLRQIHCPEPTGYQKNGVTANILNQLPTRLLRKSDFSIPEIISV